MKKYTFLLPLTAVALLGSCGESVDTKSDPKSSEDSFSYAVGVSIGNTLKRQGLDNISAGAFLRGLRDGMAKDSGYALSNEKMEEVRKSFITKKQNEKMKSLQEETKKKLESFSKESGVSMLPSRGYYKVVKAGSGSVPGAWDTVECRYIFKTGKGEVLVDNTKDKFPFRGTVKSLNLAPLEEAFLKTAAGGKFVLQVSNELNPVLSRSARNFEDMYGISVFEVELISVKPGLPGKEEPQMQVPEGMQ
jgi:FKBP-type peptidyl-prolyl cis-trans isomerase